MNQVIPFNFENYPVRTVVIDETPWWVGKDVCNALGYTNHKKAMNDHCKGVTKRYPLETTGGIQEVRILNEGDVFRLIVSSNLPEAQRFEKWLFEEVLPQIRKTGGYTNNAVPEYSLHDINMFIKESVPRIKLLSSENDRLRQMNRLYEEKEQLRQQLARKNTPIAENEKQQILACASHWSVADIARFTGRSESAVRNIIKKGGKETLRQTLGYPTLNAAKEKGGTV
jgi:prophage antirepressor-like protein